MSNSLFVLLFGSLIIDSTLPLMTFLLVHCFIFHFLFILFLYCLPIHYFCMCSYSIFYLSSDVYWF